MERSFARVLNFETRMGRSPQRQAVAEVFGQRVRAARQKHGWSLEGLAERSGLHWTYVGSVERGERNLSLVNLVRLAQALEIDPGELTKGLKISPTKRSRPQR